ncbi:MAG: hypothetical protein AB7U47_00420 [Variibacter sp.]
MGLVRFSWWENGDSFDVPLVVNRLLARGARGYWLTADDASAAAGDFILDLTSAQRAAAAAAGLKLSDFAGGPGGDGCMPLRPARIALFSGTASKYPYDAYYGLALLRLGYDFEIVDGRAIAEGALRRANVFVIPGGFATWGIDAAEESPGADAEVRAFLDRGGGAVGSCGGAYYLSAGRPGWTGTADAKPLFNHEYLQSGVGVVEVALARSVLTLGCPPALDMPYYHGPIYNEVGAGAAVVGRFANLIMPGAVAIGNPLDRALFENGMREHPAILSAEGRRGRAVLFSPHPEMGDLVRKYIAMDGYVRKYLPIRGLPTMRDTLRHYRVSDAPSFRLIANAVAWLSRSDADEAPRLDRDAQDDARAELVASLQKRGERLDLSGRTSDEKALALFLRDGLRARAGAMDGAQAGRSSAHHAALARFAAAAVARLSTEGHLPLTQELMEMELAIALQECGQRIDAIDAKLDQTR